jgi:hypothetical protein
LGQIDVDICVEQVSADCDGLGFRAANYAWLQKMVWHNAKFDRPAVLPGLDEVPWRLRVS